MITILLCILCLGIVQSQHNDNDLDRFEQYNYEIWNIGAKNLFIPFEYMSHTSRRLINIPFNSKRHISKIKAVIQPENAKLIESIYLFRCVKSSQIYSDSIDNEKNIWFEERVVTNHENERHNCWKLLAVWTEANGINKTVFSLPKNMGIPINGNDQNERYLLFEINYKSDELVEEFADYSGFQVYVRKYNSEIDADIMVVGSVPDYRLFVPPKMNEWTVTGNCYKECLQNHLFSDGFNILDVIHYTRKQFLTELSVEIKANDSNEMSTTIMKSINNQTDIRPTDTKLNDSNQIRVKCTFNSSNQTKTILGGMSDENAQCMAWIVYYPKIQDFDVCLSSFSLTTIMSITGIDHLEEQWSNVNDFDIVIKSQQNNENQRLEEFLLKKTDWDYRRINRGKYVAQFGKQTAQCKWKRNFFDLIMK